MALSNPILIVHDIFSNFIPYFLCGSLYIAKSLGDAAYDMRQLIFTKEDDDHQYDDEYLYRAD